jgi:hemerythrin-like domain-containing protein
LRHATADDPDVVRLLTDHVQLHKLILDVGAALRDGDDLTRALAALTDCLESHVRFEERELFPKIERALTPEELTELGQHLWEDTQTAVVIPGGDGCRVKISGADAPITE